METIRALFNHSNWDFDSALIGKKKSFGNYVEINSTPQRSHNDVSGSCRNLGVSDGSDDGRHRAYNINNGNNNNRQGGNDGNGDDNDSDGAAAYDDDNDDDDDGSSDDGDAFEIEGYHHCFCNPCITANRQSWLGHGVPVHKRNSELQKVRYRKFWQMLDKKQVWKHPRFLRRKTRRFNRTDDSIVWTVREIMPRCLVELVRSLFTNPAGRPYMGHKWQ